MENNNINNYLDLYNYIGEMYKVKENAFKSATDDINAQFGHLLVETDSEVESVVSELAKVQVAPKKRKESRIISKKKTSTSRKTANVIEDDDDGLFRKSSRLAAKAKILPVLPSFAEVIKAEPEEVESLSETVSSIQPPSKPRFKEEEQETSDDHFVVPEIPKMKTVKEKTEARASRRNALQNVTVTVCAGNSGNQNEDGCRKSSRIASKAKVLPAVPVMALESTHAAATSSETITFSKDDISKFWNLDRVTPLDETVCTEDIQNPLFNSTPIAFPEHEESEMQQTPTLVPVIECIEKTDSVQKRVEEFEKKAKGILAPNKLPIKTPEKKQTPKSAGLMIAKTSAKKKTTKAVPKSKLGKKANILRERNINIRPLAPALQVAKLTPKGNVEENKRKETREAAKKAYYEILKDNIEKQKGTAIQAKTFDHEQYDIERALEDESSEDEDHPKRKVPTWSTKEVREHPLAVQSWLNKEETVYPWFFSKKLKTPALEELFSTKTKMRPRTSSAVWNTRSNFYQA